jgi:uncharacterized membrane protein YdjX (TVP38/TMEM64 family)
MNQEKKLLFSNEYSSHDILATAHNSNSRGKRVKKYTKNALIFLATLTAVYFLLKYNKYVSEILEKKASLIRRSGALGKVITASLVFIFCFPVILGFGALQYLIGFVYGPLVGASIIFPPLFVGSSLCYYIFSRGAFQKMGKTMLEKNEYFSMITKLFGKKPLKMTVLCRASSLPFVSVSVLLSVLRVEYWQYFVGLILMMGKATLHMYIGSLASSHVKSSLKYVVIGLTIALNFAIGAVCGRMIQREIQKRNSQMLVVPF